MPNPTSKLNLVINGATTQLDIHDANAVPRSGGAVITGTRIARANNDADLDICGGTGWTQGGYISLRGNNSPSGAGSVVIGANNGSQSCSMGLQANGTIVFSGHYFAHLQNDSYLALRGGMDAGGVVAIYGKNYSNNAGHIEFTPWDGAINKTMLLAPNGTWTWDGTAVQITSDQRYKQQIDAIDDKLLDAWEDVELSQFKYNDAVDQKGKSARLHTGYVVQQIQKACESHGVDISQYGLFCHEEYPEETEEVEVEQADGTKTKETKVIREASEHYSLRYTEALIVECKYLRRCIERLTARIEELEKGNITK